MFSVFVGQKVTINENISFTEYSRRIRLPDFSKLAINWKNYNDVTIFQHDVIVKFFWGCFVSLSTFSYWSKFHVNIITSSGVMTIFFYRDWPEIRKSETPPSEFYPISGDWGKLGIQNLARMFLIKCYWMLQNARVTAFTISELLRENQQGREGEGTKLPPPRLGLIHLDSETSLRVWVPPLNEVKDNQCEIVRDVLNNDRDSRFLINKSSTQSINWLINQLTDKNLL